MRCKTRHLSQLHKLQEQIFCVFEKRSQDTAVSNALADPLCTKHDSDTVELRVVVAAADAYSCDRARNSAVAVAVSFVLSWCRYSASRVEIQSSVGIPAAVSQCPDSIVAFLFTQLFISLTAVAVRSFAGRTVDTAKSSVLLFLL